MRSAGWLFSVLMILVLANGCGSQQQAPPAVAPSEPPVSAGNESVITLTPSAQREAGIVVRAVLLETLPEVVRTTGRITINDNETWRVGAVTDGRIATLNVREGDRVEQGQVLAEMHSHDTHEARAGYRRAVAELEGLKANLKYAESVRDRTRRLHELKAASLQQVEHAETELRNAETALRNGEVELERNRIHLEQFLRIPAEIPDGQLLGPHEDSDYDHIPILAPAAGTLLKRNVTAGTVVEPSSDLFVITDLSTLWTMAAISEDYLSKVRIGMPVSIRVQAYPDRVFRGRLTQLDTALDPTTRTIMGRVQTPNPRGLLKPEMYATVELELSSSREAIFVPEVAVQEVNGERTVFVKSAPESFEPRMVSTAPGVGGNVEVISGLRPGDEVAVEGSFLLKTQLLKSTLAEE